GEQSDGETPPDMTECGADLLLTLGYFDGSGAIGSVACLVLRLIGEGVRAPLFAVPLTAELPTCIRRVYYPPLDVARHVICGQAAIGLAAADREQLKPIGTRTAFIHCDAGRDVDQCVVGRPQSIGSRGHRASRCGL